jgi:hypothetical protein
LKIYHLATLRDGRGTFRRRRKILDGWDRKKLSFWTADAPTFVMMLCKTAVFNFFKNPSDERQKFFCLIPTHMSEGEI